MRRLAAIGLLVAASLGLARADSAPPPPELVDVAAGDLIFLVVLHDYAAPSHPTAELVGCIDGRPNCALATEKGLIGRRVVGFDGKRFDSNEAGPQIFAAFGRDGAPAAIEIDFEPEGAAGEPLRVAFARR